MTNQKYWKIKERSDWKCNFAESFICPKSWQAVQFWIVSIFNETGYYVFCKTFLCQILIVLAPDHWSVWCNCFFFFAKLISQTCFDFVDWAAALTSTKKLQSCIILGWSISLIINSFYGCLVKRKFFLFKTLLLKRLWSKTNILF